MIDVNGKVVMISGANRGIGLAIARSLYKAGYSLSLGSRNISSLKDIIENSSDDRILNCHFDAMDKSTHKEWVSNTIDKFKNFWDDSDIGKIKTVLNKMRNGQGITNANKVRASQLIGQFNAVTPNSRTPVKRPRANNTTSNNRNAKRVTRVGTLSGQPQRLNNRTPVKRPRANNTTPNNRNVKRVTRAGTLSGQPQR